MKKTVKIETAGRRKIEGTLFFPRRTSHRHPAALFLHGWGSDRQRHFLPADLLCGMGFICLTIDLRGHGKTEKLGKAVTPRDNLRDALVSYDFLAARRDVDHDSVLIAGYSYGGFLATLLAAERKARWLVLRSPALYRDDDLDIPKASIPRRGLMAFRRRILAPDSALGLRAAGVVRSGVLLIEAEHDRIIPRQQIRNYLHAFRHAKSISHRIIRGADHAMSQERWFRSAVKSMAVWLKREERRHAG